MRSFLLGLLLVSVMVFSLSAIRSTLPVHAAASTPTLSINPSSQPLLSPGSTVTINVNVSNISPDQPLAGWEIYVRDNNSVLSPVDFTVSSSLGPGFESAHCVNNDGAGGGVGTGCSANDAAPGTVHSGFYLFGNPVSGNITLFTITYKAVRGPYSLLTFLRPSADSLLFDNSGNSMSFTPGFGSYGNVPILPVASFTWTPLNPRQGDVVTFDATSSTTPPGTTLIDYFWTFAGLNPIQVKGPNPIESQVFAAGNWSITLIVTNSQGVHSLPATLTLYVAPEITRDLAISNLIVSPVGNILPGTVLNISVTVQNAGMTSETGFNVSVSVAGSVFIAPPYAGVLVPSLSTKITFTWNTTGVQPGFYTIHARVAPLAGETNVANNDAYLTIQVVQPPDFQLILSVPPGSNTVVAGGNTAIGVQLVSTTFPYFNGNVTLTGQVSPSVSNGPTFVFNPKQVRLTYPGYPFSQLTISTTTLSPPGNYTVTVTGASGTLVHTAQFQLVVLPPPVLILSPSSGPVGTQVTVYGSGFLNPSQGPYYYPVEFQITFDDQLVGLFYLQASSFNFTFDVPDAQAGIIHQIHAKELYPSSLDVQASFLVLPQNNALTVIVGTGTIYFPGDTATIFAMTNLAGQPTTVSQLQVILVTPNGSNITLNAILITPGVYKATYTVPTAASIGTYAVIVKAHKAGSPDGSALASFEVKPTWLQSNGRNVLTATSLVGAVGVLGVMALAWRRGYFNKRKDEFLIP